MSGWFKKILKKEDPTELTAEGDEPLAEEEDEGQLAVDVFQNKDSVIVKSAIAGVKPEDLDVTIGSDQITIRGQRRQEEEVKHEDYFYQECFWGGFVRSFSLPVEVDVDKATAELKDGILTIVLPKAARSRTKKVRVRSEG